MALEQAVEGPPGPFEQFYSALEVGNGVGLVPFVVGLAGAIWPIVVLYRARTAQAAVQSGNRVFAFAMILPWYIQILVLYAAICIVQVVVEVTVPIGLADLSIINAIVNATLWGVNRLPLEGLTFVLLQDGAGVRALRRAKLQAWAIALLTTATLIPGFYFFNKWGFWLAVCWNAGFLLFYGTLWLAPASLIYRRPALRPYAAYWTVLRSFMVVSQILDRWNVDVAYLFYFIGSTLMFNLVTPVAVYQAMIMDSQFWQGFHTEKKSLIAQLTAPLEGIRLTLNSATSLATRLDELTSRANVHQLNFAYLVLDTDHLLGIGGQARVYKGTYKHQPVAIKVIFCLELTTAIVEDFCREARLLAKLAHPNIVQTLGVCVVPPTVSIVMELCERGSLYDVLHKSRDTLTLTWRTKLRMCRDCANAVAFLHSRNTVHKDIKSGNFLVKLDLTVKLADLGVSDDSVTVPIAMSPAAPLHLVDSPKNIVGAIVPGTEAPPVLDLSTAPLREMKSRGRSGSSAGFMGTVTWAAPEVLTGATYTAAADVYSLSLVMWEIISRQVPFDSDQVRHLKQPDLIAAITGQGNWTRYMPAGTKNYGFEVEGIRPPLPTNLPADFCALLCACWATNVAQRPPANAVADVLQRMLEAAGREADVAHEPVWPSGVSFPVTQPEPQSPPDASSPMRDLFNMGTSPTVPSSASPDTVSTTVNPMVVAGAPRAS